MCFLPQRGRDRRIYADRLRAGPELPRVTDSRGRIIRPPRREVREGEFDGSPVSSGKARAPVKVLPSPDEKPLLPGDVLVTRAAARGG